MIFAANICVYFQYLFVHVVCANIFGTNVLKPRFKIGPEKQAYRNQTYEGKIRVSATAQ